MCVWKGGIVSTRLTGLDGTVPAEAYNFDSNGMHIYFYEGHSINNLYFSSLQRSTNPVIGIGPYHHSIAGNFLGTKIFVVQTFHDNIFVVADCTAGKGRQGRFICG